MVFTVGLTPEIYDLDYQSLNLLSVMSNPNVSITYHAQAVNADTGEMLACGSTVPKGTKVRYEFVPHVSEDIYWFATGYALDSPYGDWGVSTVAPPVSCLDTSTCGRSRPTSLNQTCPAQSHVPISGRSTSLDQTSRTLPALQQPPPHKEGRAAEET